MAITPIYVNQLTPVELRGSLGSFSQFFNITAVVLCYAIGLLLQTTNTNPEFFWRFMFAFTQLTILLQSILLLINFIPESPSSLIQSNKFDESKKVIALFNKQQKVDEVFKQYIKSSSKNKVKINYDNKAKENKYEIDVELTSRSFSQPKIFKVSDQNDEQDSNKLPAVLMTPSIEKGPSHSNNLTIDMQELESSQNKQNQQDQNPLIKKKKEAIPFKSLILGFQLPLMQPMSGVKAMVTQMRMIMLIYDPVLAMYTPLVVNIFQLLGTGLSILVFSKFGRRPILTLGSLGVALCDLSVACFFLGYQFSKSDTLVFIAIAIVLLFMVIYGMTIGPGVWLYVPEIVPHRIVPAATFMNWLGASLTVILTPIIIQREGSAYPLFFFFAAISLVFSAINWWLVVQTKGLRKSQIIEKLL